MDIILKYFPELKTAQIAAYEKLKSLYEDFNEKVNLISRKDIDHIYLHHVLHSMTISKFVQFKDDCKILDLGTGGGFPAVPLAILYPEIKFTAIDGTGKKIKIVQEIAEELHLHNLHAIHIRAEDYKGHYHFIVSRAVTGLQELYNLTKNKFKKESITALPNGLIAYKGGNLQQELNDLHSGKYYEAWDIYEKFPEEYFKDKKLVYLQA